MRKYDLFMVSNVLPVMNFRVETAGSHTHTKFYSELCILVTNLNNLSQ
jgi:hypothetical protein